MKIRKNLMVIIILTASVLWWPCYAGAVVQWTKSGSNPVLTTATSGDWDDYGVGNPKVIKDGATYKMWYAGTDDIEGTGTPQTGYATSPDGIVWTRGNSGAPVLSPGSSGEWDDGEAMAGTVIKDDGTYKMWYTGSEENIGYATSTDGITWVKYNDPNTTTAPYAESDPVLKTALPGGDWDGSRVQDPAVIIDLDASPSERYKMWYAGSDDISGTNGIGYATSDNGIDWTKYENQVIWRGPAGSWNERSLTNPTVIKEESVYRMWLRGKDYGTLIRSIGYFYSIDGVNWTQYKGNPIIMKGTTPGDFDEYGASEPSVIKDGNTYKMWYTGDKNCDSCLYQIGYATVPAYQGSHLAINKMRVTTDNRSSGLNTIIDFVPEGPGPLDFNELRIEGPGEFVHTFTDSDLWNSAGYQAPSFFLSYPINAGTYTFTAKSNNGLTDINSIVFGNPTPIPVYDNGDTGFDMKIMVDGSAHYKRDYISSTTPTFRFKPVAGGSRYYRVQLFDYKFTWTVWVSNLILGSDAVDEYIDIPMPANILVSDAPYRWRAEIYDTNDIWTAQTRSVSDSWEFYTGTKDETATPDFINWATFWSQRSFLYGEQASFGFKIINLAPWDIDDSPGNFSVLNENATTLYNFSFNNNCGNTRTDFYFWGGFSGIPDAAMSSGYAFVATENTNGYFDTANRTFEDVPTLPQVTREDMVPEDNAYLADTTPTLSWISKGTGYKYRVFITTWTGHEFYISTRQDGLPAGQTMSETIPYGILKGHNPYIWWVEVFDTNLNSRTRSNRLTFMTGELLTCDGDFEPDGDVDGKDLAEYISDSRDVDLEDFAANFGKDDCPF
jgi:hypothetical protein